MLGTPTHKPRPSRSIPVVRFAFPPVLNTTQQEALRNAEAARAAAEQRCFKLKEENDKLTTLLEVTVARYTDQVTEHLRFEAD